MSPRSTRPPPPPRLYFAYGSNLAFQQMATRCPGSSYVGRAVLPDYRWQINERGYANILPFPGSSVHGLVFELGNDPSSPSSDEARLDRSEGVNSGAYLKETCAVVLYPARRKVRTSSAAAELARGEPVGGASGREGFPRVEDDVLVYLSDVFVRPGSPRDEYVDRINNGIRDAVAMGVPAAYFTNVVREWVPERAQPASSSVRRAPTAREELAELIRRREELERRLPSRPRSLTCYQVHHSHLVSLTIVVSPERR
ncbi:hypothetical protein C8A01DRAFT_50466 [Parachaetomium inaequale]|uniref:gamma-glutamylcyclotransferase n=1 Tax=Parachaetomium inaequale TaxID=2588326 RepID=A0AAN6SM98_9PEZI|nr:hypothetical protein C8A01DRAFT_50466 [Parachaetomium inaequale]